jgi:hypothetical protein
VPFAPIMNILNHTDIILQFSTELIDRPERFCKKTFGWLLREYFKIDFKFVTCFFENNKV